MALLGEGVKVHYLLKAQNPLGKTSRDRKVKQQPVFLPSVDKTALQSIHTYDEARHPM
jgi:hypothetical protein